MTRISELVTYHILVLRIDVKVAVVVGHCRYPPAIAGGKSRARVMISPFQNACVYQIIK